VRETAFGWLLRQKPSVFPRNVMPVVCDDACDWHDRVVDTGRDVREVVRGQRLRPPWASTWLDMRMLSEDCSGIVPDVRMGVHVAAGPASAAEQAVKSAFPGALEGIKPFIPGSNALCMQFIVASPTGHVDVGVCLVECDENWIRSDNMNRYVVPAPDLKTGLGALLSNWSTIAVHVLALLHVKNATFVDLSAPRAERRRAIREGHPVVTVKELVIAPMRRTLAMIRAAEAAHPGQPIPLHLCRGHFKTFTTERPLLGRHTGTYWWEPHLRGSADNGVVIHDAARLALGAA
jgi:hypothetical protein